ncbi:hypothetical protein AIOGIFDO_00930 [Candidatus Methanoperedenaceae archaeon GB37]|nr:hypothetical protein AIOGIFDO_00930 [Candidatus Methanoperedenaceae archaeon GB37]
MTYTLLKDSCGVCIKRMQPCEMTRIVLEFSGGWLPYYSRDSIIPMSVLERASLK